MFVCVIKALPKYLGWVLICLLNLVITLCLPSVAAIFQDMKRASWFVGDGQHTLKKIRFICPYVESKCICGL